jgi:hypothetical protein
MSRDGAWRHSSSDNLDGCNAWKCSSGTWWREELCVKLTLRRLLGAIRSANIIAFCIVIRSLAPSRGYGNGARFG